MISFDPIKYNILLLNISGFQLMGSHRSVPELKKDTLNKNFKNLTYGVSHMCGWRLYMQDAHISIAPFTNKNNALFGVFDGHGGPQVAVFVQKHFPEELQKNQNYQKQDYEKALRQTFLKMDQLLLSEQGKHEIQCIQKSERQKQNTSKMQQQSHAGCTANVCLITPTFIYIANAGDSRCVASIKGQCKQLSIDHKPEDQIQIARIEKAGGSVTWGRVNGNLNLSRALGDLQYKTTKQLSAQQQMITANPDIVKIPNQNIDFIIMGCDGIWEVKKNEQMVSWIQKRINKQKQLGSIVEQLLDELVAKDNGGQYGMDNMSAILIKFENK